jgi:hypothetical protein
MICSRCRREEVVVDLLSNKLWVLVDLSPDLWVFG